jgi:uncharacterized FAD-dependent dehydrogenase
MNPLRIELKLTPAQAADPDEVARQAAARAGLPDRDLIVVPVRRSVDARKGEPRVVLLLDLWRGTSPQPPLPILGAVPEKKRGRVVIVGAGPAGYFCALRLLMQGVRPIVLERGKDTRARRYDLRAIMQQDTVNPHSNYCFGEGGAGTYSDGKLYTRSGKRDEIQKVLRMLVDHGAQPGILVDTHPHIGSNKLPYVVENLRASIEVHGGEVHFGSHVTDLLLSGDTLRGVVTSDGQSFEGDAVVLATGHSARDIFYLLHRRQILLEAKTFALGVRVEHPQPLIDEIQYRQKPRDPNLPAASYRLAQDDVYSFCMCPGGLMVPAATAPGEVVVNGMSMSRRDSRWANSGIVTTVTEADLAPYRDEHGPLAGLAFQQQVERTAFAANGDGSQKAPAQRLQDFLTGQVSSDLPRVSYIPGVVSVDLHAVLPERLAQTLAHGFRQFAGSLNGFLSQDAVIVGVESRTSSPVRIPRDIATLAHPQLANLYPCGEGAGYAGGIVSAAMDGQRVADAVAKTIPEGLCGGKFHRRD